MKFISKDVASNKPLKRFLTKVQATGETIVKENYLYDIYDTETAIEVLKNKIKYHSKGTNLTRLIPSWEAHIKYLQEMENAS